MTSRSRRSAPRSLIQLLVRFSAVYAILIALSFYLPVYQWIDIAAARVVDASFSLIDGPGVERSLRLDEREGVWGYVYGVEKRKNPKTITAPFHAHAFVLVLYVALVLGTPGISWQRMLLALGAGGVLVFLIGVGMLVVDVQGWEKGPGPFPRIVGVMNGLHLTAAGGLLPLVLWGFVIAGPFFAAPRRRDSGVS